MKIILLSLAAAATSPLLYGQQAAPPPPLVSTTGSAEIRVVPDLADLSFEVEVRSADLATARKQQAERATKVLAALRAGGIPEAELQTSQVQIDANYSDNSDHYRETDKVKFYRVWQDVCCTLHDLKKVPDLTAGVVAAGATGVSTASFRTSELRKYRDQARAQAVRAAKEKALALAAELGVKVGKPYSISERAGLDWGNGMNNPSRSQNFQNSATAVEHPEDGTNPAFAPGMISVAANVSVSFVLE